MAKKRYEIFERPLEIPDIRISEMALTAAERAKRYREKKKANAETRESFLETERISQRQLYIPIANKTQREKRATRNNWRKNQRASRNSRENLAHIVTPPSSPTDDIVGAAPPNTHPSSAKRRGRKYIRRDRAKVRRDNMKLKVKLAIADKQSQRYRKRYERLKERHSKSTNSPATKTRKLLKGHVVSNKIRRTLLCHNAVMEQLRVKYRNNASQRKKAFIAKLLRGKILKKCLVTERVRTALGSCSRDRASFGTFAREHRCDALTERQLDTVKAFYERDDVSRLLSGKKDYIIRRKVRKQKRWLQDTIRNIHMRFQIEYTDIPVSYAKFCSLRPFWVITPRIHERDTCLCAKHANVELIADALRRAAVIQSSDIASLQHGKYLLYVRRM